MLGNIFLIGFMGCGKSSVAAKLHEQYRMNVVEMDEEIVRREERSIADIFAQEGEAYFRQIESLVLCEVAEHTNQVISCGGGIILRPENVALMKQTGKIVLLTAAPETILQRVQGDENRPLLNGKKTVEDIAALMEQRRAAYGAAADVVIETDEKSIADICRELMKHTEKVEE